MERTVIPYKLKSYIARDESTPANGRGYRKVLYDSELTTKADQNAELTIR